MLLTWCVSGSLCPKPEGRDNLCVERTKGVIAKGVIVKPGCSRPRGSAGEFRSLSLYDSLYLSVSLSLYLYLYIYPSMYIIRISRSGQIRCDTIYYELWAPLSFPDSGLAEGSPWGSIKRGLETGGFRVTRKMFDQGAKTLA